MCKKNILLYSPNLKGHPQVYCRVIGDAMLDSGSNILIAAGDIADLPNRWPDLEPLSRNKNVKFIATTEFSESNSNQLKAEELCRIQSDYLIDATLFIEPEFFRDEFIRISLGLTPKLHGRNVGIFGGTTLWYPGEEFYSGRKIRLFDSTFRQILGRLVRRYTKPWTIDKYFFEKIVLSSGILDTVIVKDERVAKKYPDQVRWLPEIYKIFNEQGSVEDSEYCIHAPRLERYLHDVEPDNLVLFFGAGAWYKGYDYFLEFMARDSKVKAIHAGSGIWVEEHKEFIGNPEKTRNSLLSTSRLYETGQYVSSKKLVELVFRSTRRFLSTHRLTVSSGTMLQALDYGLPVLTPESGLVGYRTREFGLGETYRYGDIDDMVYKWNKFCQIPVELYQSSIERFMARFSQKRVTELFVDVLLH